jgi:hypothetical protein
MDFGKCDLLSHFLDPRYSDENFESRDRGSMGSGLQPRPPFFYMFKDSSTLQPRGALLLGKQWPRSMQAF